MFRTIGVVLFLSGLASAVNAQTKTISYTKTQLLSDMKALYGDKAKNQPKDPDGGFTYSPTVIKEGDRYFMIGQANTPDDCSFNSLSRVMQYFLQTKYPNYLMGDTTFFYALNEKYIVRYTDDNKYGCGAPAGSRCCKIDPDAFAVKEPVDLLASITLEPKI